jgi:hypothetical protein
VGETVGPQGRARGVREGLDRGVCALPATRPAAAGGTCSGKPSHPMKYVSINNHLRWYDSCRGHAAARYGKGASYGEGLQAEDGAQLGLHPPARLGLRLRLERAHELALSLCLGLNLPPQPAQLAADAGDLGLQPRPACARTRRTIHWVDAPGCSTCMHACGVCPGPGCSSPPTQGRSWPAAATCARAVGPRHIFRI